MVPMAKNEAFLCSDRGNNTNVRLSLGGSFTIPKFLSGVERAVGCGARRSEWVDIVQYAVRLWLAFVGHVLRWNFHSV